MRHARPILTCSLLSLLLLSHAAAQPPPTLDSLVPQRLAAILDSAQQTNDFAAARDAAQILFDQVVLYAPRTSAAAFREAAFLRRLTRQLAQIPPEGRVELLQFLRANPALATTLVFLIHDSEKPAPIYAVLQALRAEHSQYLNEYASLAAAVCVVHDRKIVHRVNENNAESPGPIPIFDYYRTNEKQMLLGIRNMPAELLVFVVDIGATLEEMDWARQRYAGEQKVGSLFHEIAYDHDHLRGVPKKSTVAGWGLLNILRHGGVCADQAHYAVTVGKAIGVPAAYTRARSGQVGHAWVGFLEQRANRGAWNFDYGRFGAYKTIKGVTADPQTGEILPDSFVGLMAEMIGSKTVDRHNTAAYVEAAQRLLELAGASETQPPIQPPFDTARPARQPNATHADLLLETALRSCAGYAPLWLTVRDMAAANLLNLSQKKTWGQRLEKVCGAKYPDFTLAIYIPMIQSIRETREQNTLWEALYRANQHRVDLAAEIRVLQGEMWLAAGDVLKAGTCYEEVITRFTNGGPFVIQALKRAEELLVTAGRANRVVDLYQQTWARTERPKETTAVFFTQSNWFNIGRLYAAKLREAGQESRAAEVVHTLESASGVKLRDLRN